MARTFIQDKWHQLKYVYLSSRFKGVAVEVLRKLMAPLYHRSVGYLLMYRVDARDPDSRPAEISLPPGLEHVVLQDEAGLKPFEAELPSQIRYSAGHLRAALRNGSILFLILRPRERGAGFEVVGYSIHERGVVEFFGRRHPAGADVLFLHYTEVLPAYRGARIAYYIAEVVAGYSRTGGITRWCTWIGSRNRSALKARERIGWFPVGKITQTRVLGGLFSRHTPWRRIEAMLRQS